MAACKRYDGMESHNGYVNACMNADADMFAGFCVFRDRPPLLDSVITWWARVGTISHMMRSE